MSRFWLVDFLPLLKLLIFTELAHSFAHNYFSFLIILFMFLQGGLAFASKIAHLKHPELRKLVADLPLRTIEAKARVGGGGDTAIYGLYRYMPL